MTAHNDAPVQAVYRLTFAKRGPMRFLSQLDLVRLMERAIRRAQLPVTFTRGFNPRPRFAILAPLPVGVEANAELMSIRLDEPVEPSEISERLNAQIADGIEFTNVEFTGKTPNPDMWAHYDIVLPDGANVGKEATDALLARREVPVEMPKGKRRRTVDIRPFIVALEPDGNILRFVAKVGGRGTARPDALLKALLGDDAAREGNFKITRTLLSLSAPEPASTAETAGIDAGDKAI